MLTSLGHTAATLPPEGTQTTRVHVVVASGIVVRCGSSRPCRLDLEQSGKREYPWANSDPAPFAVLLTIVGSPSARNRRHRPAEDEITSIPALVKLEIPLVVTLTIPPVASPNFAGRPPVITVI